MILAQMQGHAVTFLYLAKVTPHRCEIRGERYDLWGQSSGEHYSRY